MYFYYISLSILGTIFVNKVTLNNQRRYAFFERYFMHTNANPWVDQHVHLQAYDEEVLSRKETPARYTTMLRMLVVQTGLFLVSGNNVFRHANSMS
jgi:hypothetical protein